MRALIVYAAFFWTIAPLLAVQKNVPPDFSKPQTWLRLADAFADEKDYYRAITEYKKVIHLFPAYPKLDWVHFQIGKMYYEGGRFTQAKHELIPLSDAKDERLRFLSLNYIALSYYENNEFSNADRLFRDLKDQQGGLPYVLDYTIYSSMAAAGDRKFGAAYERMLEARKKWQDQGDASAAAAQYGPFFEKSLPILEKAKELSTKSPVWATIFSVLFPGGGHFFLGEWDTGIVSLSIVGGAAFLAYDGFVHNNTVQSLLFTTFATGAYIGQIYSSYRTARKYNEELGDNEFRDLSRQFRSLNVALQFQTRF
ncbi:MAG: hypothetical protein JSR44_03795 [Spirochaetes bacterium]|nr:hypothetical protein [Spirochaetota bacterium]